MPSEPGNCERRKGGWRTARRPFVSPQRVAHTHRSRQHEAQRQWVEAEHGMGLLDKQVFETVRKKEQTVDGVMAAARKAAGVDMLVVVGRMEQMMEVEHMARVRAAACHGKSEAAAAGDEHDTRDKQAHRCLLGSLPHRHRIRKCGRDEHGSAKGNDRRRKSCHTQRRYQNDSVRVGMQPLGLITTPIQVYTHL